MSPLPKFLGNPSKPIEVIDWGKIDYSEAWQKQKLRVEARISGEVPDAIIFCEHPPVVTLGRGNKREAPELYIPPQVPVIEVERGGLATYHGPGQLVCYPIFKLNQDKEGARSGVVGLIRALENWIIQSLSAEGLRSGAVIGKTGVWVDEQRKICSIGIAVRRWVSYHGLALNYSTGSEPWAWLNPCGFSANVMTDLSREKGRPYTYHQMVELLLKHSQELT